MANIISVGEKFPEFSLAAVTATDDFSVVTHENMRSKWTVLFYWPLDFTFVCPTEIVDFDRLTPAFRERGAEVYGVSLDSKYVHLAWKKSHGDLAKISYSMLADNKHELISKLGILHPTAGLALRATYIIDPEGYVRWLGLNDIEVGRSADEVLRNFDALQTGELCPANWKRGQKTL